MTIIEVPLKEKVYTYDDYLKLPEGAPYQLIGGRLIMTPAPSTYHQDISLKLSVKLAGFVMEEKLGKVFHAPIDVYFEETETYQPDIIFISRERLNIIEEERIKGAPDLVVEILSPRTAYYDLKKKFKVYERHGVREYWIVDPQDRSIAVYENREGEFILAREVAGKGMVESKILPGFHLEVETIW
jgi:Uma2 family endonuclease